MPNVQEELELPLDLVPTDLVPVVPSNSPVVELPIKMKQSLLIQVIRGEKMELIPVKLQLKNNQMFANFDWTSKNSPLLNLMKTVSVPPTPSWSEPQLVKDYPSFAVKTVANTVSCKL